MTKAPSPDVLQISPEKVCDLIALARESQIGNGGVDSGEPLGDSATTSQELKSFFEGLNVDERLDLVCLMWVGRGTYELEEWAEARKTAKEEATHSTSDYLLGTSLLADYLEEGLGAFGFSCS